jgi:uncharacterized protein (TIGR02757 family)
LLEALYARHHRLENLYPDPLIFARGYEDPREGELAGLVAAALAYGRVEKIVEALDGVFQALGPRPRQTLEGWSPAELAEGFRGFAYRFHKATDLALFLHLVRQALDRWGSLADLFRNGDAETEVGPALVAFAHTIFSGDPRPVLRTRSIPEGHPVFHLLPSPSKGGSAKRLCLFLRWMVRQDAIDPGYWHGRIDPSRLVIPLDTHVARVARELALTSRKSVGWATAREITTALGRYDPADPVRFDFCLFRFGMGRGDPTAAGDSGVSRAGESQPG